MAEFQETNSGFKKEGDISEVADFADQVEEGLKDQVSEESIKEFEEWRPEEDDSEKDIEKKTVKSASINKRDVEEKSSTVKDFSKAGKRTYKAGKNVKNPGKAGKELSEASKSLARSLYLGTVKAARGLEEVIYSNIMVKLNPYFFDTKEFSANLRAENSEDYSMEINVPDKESRNRLRDSLEGKND